MIAVVLALVSTALAGKWDDKNADVVAVRTIPVPAEAVYAVLSDPTKLMALYPSDCAVWKVPLTGDVPGAKGIVTYKAAGMRRKLDVVWKTATPSQRIELDHLGPKGFVTRFELAPADGGTTVTMTNYISIPAFIAGYYYKKVQPAWQGCHARELEALETIAKG